MSSPIASSKNAPVCDQFICIPYVLISINNAENKLHSLTHINKLCFSTCFKHIYTQVFELNATRIIAAHVPPMTNGIFAFDLWLLTTHFFSHTHTQTDSHSYSNTNKQYIVCYFLFFFSSFLAYELIHNPIAPVALC